MVLVTLYDQLIFEKYDFLAFWNLWTKLKQFKVFYLQQLVSF